MKFMNEYEIDEARERWRDHPVLGPATLTLESLRDAANANSDGWASWPKPARAAAKLMELIERDGTTQYMYGDREDATPELLRAALRPIKTFRTQSGLTFEIFEELPVAEPAQAEASLQDQPIVIEGHTFEPWFDGQAVGFKVTHRDGRVEYAFLCPSSPQSPGAAPEAGVVLFSHRGPGEPNGEPVPNDTNDPDLDGPYLGDPGLFSLGLFTSD